MPLLKSRILYEFKCREPTNRPISLDESLTEDATAECSSCEHPDTPHSAWRTCAGTRGSQDKLNQDRVVAGSTLANSQLFMVCDGHGQNGHLVAEFLCQHYPAILSSLQQEPGAALKSACFRLSAALDSSGIEITLSGSTMVAVLFDSKVLHCANVGDSRGIIGKLLEISQQWTPVPLSRDHRPHVPEERSRILRQKGIVAHNRVWLPNTNIGGLAVARAFGDALCRGIGVTAEPEVLKYTLRHTDKFLVLGSDGLFEVMDNQQVVDLIVPFYIANDVDGAVQQLVRVARARWVGHRTGTDDITCIVVFLV